MLRATTFLLLLSLPLTARSAAAVKPAVDDALVLLPPGGVEIGGWLGEQLQICRQGRIVGQDIDDLVRPFATRPEDKMWQTEFWGKWFTSAALAYRYQPDAQARAILDRAVKGLLGTQTPDGYIGTYKKEAELKGWDVWGRKYVLLGLLAYYDLTGDRAVLDAACRHADYTIGQIGPGKADIVRLGMWTGMAASSILEPMVLLYQRTGQSRYLEFAEYIVAQWATPQGPDLLRKALAGVSVFDMFAKPDPKQKGYMAGGASKSYEMMSCYEGLLELYRVTGKREYRDAVVKVFNNIRDTEITAIGSGSSWERWCNGRRRQGEAVPEWMETCVTVTWVKLAGQLLRLTGEAGYADAIELSTQNALLAAQKTDGTWWSHYNPLEGVRGPAPEQCKMHANCCVASGPRGAFLLPHLAVMRGKAGPVVNAYGPGKARVPLSHQNEVSLEQRGDFARDGVVEIAVSPREPADFTLALRIPAWSRKTQIAINGQESATPAPDGYARVARRWNPGDRIRLAFDMTARCLAEPGGSGRVALQRGPVVFAVDKRLVQPQSGQARVAVGADNTVDVCLVTQALPEGIRMAIDVPMVLANGQRRMLRMCDYSSAGRTWSADSLLRVWLPQPLDLADPLAGVAMGEKH